MIRNLPTVTEAGSNAQVEPLVTIVTVMFRDPLGLQRSLASFAKLPPEFELVIVEGEPADVGGAQECVRGMHQSRRVRIVQGEDAGPYDAMNRGIQLAEGGWIWFVNAGDEVAPDLDVQNLVKILTSTDKAWAVGVTTVKRGEDARDKGYPGTSELLAGVDTPCHQGLLVRREALLATGPFDTSLKISADYKMMCQLANIGDPEIINGRVALFFRGGMSETRWRRREFENFMVRASVAQNPRRAVDCLRMVKRICRIPAPFRRKARAVQSL